MSVLYVLSRALLVAGTAVLVLSAVGALLADDFYDRLHFVAPATSVGLPLVGLSAAVSQGWGEASAQILLTVFIVALAGPALTAATGRVAAQRDGLVDQDSPD